MDTIINSHITRLLQTITGENQINITDVILNEEENGAIRLNNGIILANPYAQNEVVCIALDSLDIKQLHNSKSVDYNAIIESAARKFWSQSKMDGSNADDY